MEPFQFSFQESRISQPENLLQPAAPAQREKIQELEDKEWERFLTNKRELEILHNQRKSHVSLRTPRNRPNMQIKLQSKVSSLCNRSLTIIDCNNSIDANNSSLSTVSEHHLSPIYEITRNVSDNSLLPKCDAPFASSLSDGSICEHNMLNSLNLELPQSSQENVQQSKPLLQINKSNAQLNSSRILDFQPSNNEESASLQTVQKKGEPIISLYFNIESRERIKSFWMKMEFCLDKILYLLDKTPVPEDIKDDNRRQKRAADFSVLFGRNHLYPFGRKLKALTEEVENAVVTFRELRIPVSKKLVEAHQYATNALAAYANHMPSSVAMGLPERLRALLKLVENLCDLCRRLEMTTVADDGDGHKSGFDLVEEKSKHLLKEVDKQEEKVAEARLAKLKHLDSLHTKTQTKKNMWMKYSPYALPLPFTQVYRRPIKKLARAKWGPPRKDRKQHRKGLSTTNCTIGTDLVRRRHPQCEPRIVTPFHDSDNVETWMDVVAKREESSTRAGRQTVSDGNVPVPPNPSNLAKSVCSDTSHGPKSRGSSAYVLETLMDPKQFVKKVPSAMKNRRNQQQRTYGVKNAQLIILPESETHEQQQILRKENSNKYANQKANKRSSTKLAEHNSPDSSPSLMASIDTTTAPTSRNEIKNQVQPLRESRTKLAEGISPDSSPLLMADIDAGTVPKSRNCIRPDESRNQAKPWQDQKVKKSRMLQPNGLKRRCDTQCEEESGQTTSTLGSEPIQRVKPDVRNQLLPRAHARHTSTNKKTEMVSLPARQMRPSHEKSLPTPRRQHCSSNKEELTVTEYTNQFKDYIENLVIYREEMKPWSLIAKLGTELTYKAVTGMVKEFQVEPIVSMICKLELQ